MINFFLVSGFLVCAIIALQTTSYAGMPSMNPQELADFEKFLQELEKPEMQKIIKDFEEQFNSLPPEVQEELNKQAVEDLKRMGIDPYTYQPTVNPPSPTPVTPQPAIEKPVPTPQESQEPSLFGNGKK